MIITGFVISVAFMSLHAQSVTDQPKISFNVNQGNSGGQFILNYKNPAPPFTVMVFDITGKYVYLKNYKDSGSELKEVIDLSAYPKGIYVFEIETNDSREAKKLIYQ